MEAKIDVGTMVWCPGVQLRGNIIDVFQQGVAYGDWFLVRFDDRREPARWVHGGDCVMWVRGGSLKRA